MNLDFLSVSALFQNHILGPDGAKLSKRHGGVSVAEYKKEGFLPDALANCLVLLGWSPGDENEVLSLQEAAKIFDIKALNDVQAKFDIQKLRWLNAEHIMRKETADLIPLLKGRLEEAGYDTARIPGEYLARVAGLYKVRLKTLGDFVEMTDFFFRDDFTVEEEGRKKHLESQESRSLLRNFAERLEPVEDLRPEIIEKACQDLAGEKGIKPAKIIHPARMAVSGKTRGAGLFEMMEVLGKDRVIDRLRRAAT